MPLGIVSDTHNNKRNIEIIISIFNSQKVDLVIHTGDIANKESLSMFSTLKCPLVGVFGNNDRYQEGIRETAKMYGFKFQDPPLHIKSGNRNIAIFHEPDNIDNFLLEKPDFDIVVHGHTHRYREEIINKTLIFNPGESAGMMKGKNAIGIISLQNLHAERIFF